MVRWDQPRQAVQAVSLLATFILGGSAAEASLRAESLAAGRTLTAVPTTPMSLGCFRDSTENRVLEATPSTSTTKATMTPDVCAAICSEQGGTLETGSYKYYAVQFGRECWCGQEEVEYAKYGESDECSMPCKGDRSIYCGGIDAFEIFEYSTAVSAQPEPLGCWVDDKDARVFRTPHAVSTTNTPEECEKYCADAGGFAYFGLQYGRECFCGLHGEDYTQHGQSKECTEDCSGDRSLRCGGVNAIEVYGFGGAAPPATPAPMAAPAPRAPVTPAPVSPAPAPRAPVTPAPVSPAPVTRAPVSPVPVNQPAGPPGHLGCWRDDEKRIFDLDPTVDRNNTPENCQDTCREYEYFGLQYGNECFCGKSDEDYKKYGESDACDVACGGDYSETSCGGAWAMDVFSTNDYIPDDGADHNPPDDVADHTTSDDACNVVLIEAEDLDLVGDWWSIDDPAASGGKYIVWQGLNGNTQISKTPVDVITVPIHITVAGTYHFKWKMRQPEGVESDQANDSWLDFPDAARFGPEDRSAAGYGGFVKVYGNAFDGDFEFSGTADVDHVRTEVAVDFKETGWYTMEIAGRSHGHQIDQIILFQESLNVEDAAHGCK